MTFGCARAPPRSSPAAGSGENAFSFGTDGKPTARPYAGSTPTTGKYSQNEVGIAL